MKRLVLILMVACLLALGGQSFAELCTIDAVPAATLLLPHFQVDIGDDNGNGVADCADGVGLDTLFSINNASAAPALAHVTLWTDWTFPTLDFDVYLTGFDMQSVSLCQVIANGSLPVTADVQADPDDEISPSPWGQDTSVVNCAGVFPFPDPIVTGALLQRVQNGHTGQPLAIGPQPGAGCDPGDCCVGNEFGDEIARGYVTVDSASQCSTVFPNEDGYFEAGGNGIANNSNILWGDWFLIDRANNFAQGDNLVHIEADESLEIGAGGPNAATGYTFYGRYLSSTGPGTFAGWDGREPLGTTWAARYLNGGPFSGGTHFTVWRDSTFDFSDNTRGWDCGACAAGLPIGPPWCPLNETQVVCFDEAEDCEELCFEFGGGVISPPTLPTDPVCFPLESNFTQVGAGDLTPSWPFGWCFLNLNHTFSGTPGGAPWPPGGGPIAQSYVSVNHDALGLYSVGYAAIELTSACSDANPTINTLTPPDDPEGPILLPP